MKNKDINVYVAKDSSKAMVEFIDKVYPAVIGKAGAIDESAKKEGDWKTPIGGPYKILNVYYREDRLEKPRTKVQITALAKNDIWIDDQADDRYNKPAKIKGTEERASHENLYRDDHLYDLIVDIGFNRENIMIGRGSAIFMHLSRDQETPSNTPTAGCIAFRKSDLLEMIQKMDTSTKIYIQLAKYPKAAAYKGFRVL